MERKVYVRSFARISLRHPDPDYTGMFPVMEARRLSRLMKRALAVSQQALSEGGIAVPDAIVTGTGLGCIENTEIFLDALCREGEDQMMPTRFMSSTHNTMSSIVAIKLRCNRWHAV